MKKKQPSTTEELQKDIESHPDRGKLDGEPVVRFDSKELSGSIPRTLHNEFLLICGSKGYNKSQGLTEAVSQWVADQGNQTAKENFIKRKAQQHQVSESEVASKVFGCFKDAGRRRKQRFQQAATDSESTDSDWLDAIAMTKIHLVGERFFSGEMSRTRANLRHK